MTKLAQYLKAKGMWPLRAELPLVKAMEETSKQFAKESGQEDWRTPAGAIIERFEGMARLIPGGKVVAYPDPGTGAEPWTIGIGSTTDEEGHPIAPGTVWTVERARARFMKGLESYGRAVDEALAGKPVTANQKAAMTSLCYNIGPIAFARSTVAKAHRAGNYPAAADAFRLWDKAGGRVMKGLVRRREAERALYLS